MLLKEVFDTVELAWSILGKNIKIMELGNQRMKWHEAQTAKKFFMEYEGALEHISIDMNGKSGALRLDLSKDLVELRPEWKGNFDLVTNYGTAEHVDKGLYECYKNIHNFCRVGGIMINDGPPSCGCPWHSPYHYYPHFFSTFAKVCGYELLLRDARAVRGRKKICHHKDRTLEIAVYHKIHDTEFISKEKFESLEGYTYIKAGQ